MTQRHGNVDKIVYGSGNRSVISRTIADSRLKNKNDLIPIATPPAVDPNVVNNLPNQSSNKYYANHTPRTQPQAIPNSGMIKLSGRVQAPVVANGVQTVVVSVSDLREKMQTVVGLLQQGYSQVQVALAHVSLQLAARTQLDLAITREEITEDQARDVKFGVANSGLPETVVVDMLDVTPVKVEVPPTLTTDLPEAIDPTEEQLEDAEAFTGDPMAFVLGNDETKADLEKWADAKAAEEDEGD